MMTPDEPKPGITERLRRLVFGPAPRVKYPRWHILHRKVTPNCSMCNERMTRQTFTVARHEGHKRVRRKSWNCAGCESATARLNFMVAKARKSIKPQEAAA